LLFARLFASFGWGQHHHVEERGGTLVHAFAATVTVVFYPFTNLQDKAGEYFFAAPTTMGVGSGGRAPSGFSYMIQI